MKSIWTTVAKVVSMVCLCAFAGMAMDTQAQDLDTTKIHSAILKPGEIQEGILVFEDEAGDWKIWWDHRMYWDIAVYNTPDEIPMQNGMQLRRGIIQFKATMYRDWEAYIDLNAGRGSGATPRDFWLKRYFDIGDWTLELQAGNFKEVSGLERLTSSRMLTFLERSGDSIFEEGRRKGFVATLYNNHNFWTEWGIHGQVIDENRFEEDNEAFGFNGRMVFLPIHQHRRIVHLGAWGSIRPPDADNDNRVRLRGRPESRISDNSSYRFLNTGHITDVDNYTRFGLEFGAVMGSFQIQSEYKRFHVNRMNNLPDPSFWGGYLKASYFLTGESRGYAISEGEFANFDHPVNSWGALQLAARYSIHDVTDKDADIYGGRQDILTLGLNYYATRFIKFNFNYAFVFNDKYADGDGSLVPKDFSMFQTRMLVRLP
ncbi:porin [Balneolaceae bacterium ANBcel3]|nr:porin [Balneolaceae bacterium ANBcel3]